MENEKEYYGNEERKAVKHATENGVSFEAAAIISRDIKREGLTGFEYLQMLKGKLGDEVRKN